MAQPTAPTSLDRLLVALRKLTRAEFPQMAFLACQEYRVTSAGDGTVDAEPADPSLALPSLVGVPTLLPFGLAPAIGDTVVIRFLNGDPTKPRARGFSVPPRLNLGGTPNADAARKADDVTWNVLPIVVNGLFNLAPGVIGTMIPVVPSVFGSITIGAQSAGAAT
jgi:hypothetical protein